MALQKIPMLEQDYPLFDWSEYQSSFEALEKDHLVSDFTKETWNAIVDTLSSALIAAGLEWDNKYTTAEGAKVTKAYGALSAKMFNSVRHNIDRPASLGWVWARREDFRGYVGREDFRGYSEYGRNCDLFYPEYIIELVRKLNLLIEIMRDTANTSNVVYQDSSSTIIYPNLLPRKSAPFAFDKMSECNILGGAAAPLSAAMAINENIETLNLANMLARYAFIVVGLALSLTDTKSEIIKCKSLAVASQISTGSLDFAEAIRRVAVRAAATCPSFSKEKGEVLACKPLPFALFYFSYTESSSM